VKSTKSAKLIDQEVGACLAFLPVRRPVGAPRQCVRVDAMALGVV
jgi:hypothetical protein